MRLSVGYIFLFSLFFILACSPTYAATIYGGKLFHSQNFTTVVGGNFKIYGIGPYEVFNNKTEITETHYKKAVIQSDIDERVEIKDGECVYTTLYKYCFKGSSVDFDNPYTFANSQINSVMSITIESLPPSMTSITVKRASKITAFCGQTIPIEINLTNGGTMITNVTYSERLPENTFILENKGGSVNLNVFTLQDRLLGNATKGYSYTLMDLDCQPKNWTAIYTYTALNGSLITKNISLQLVMNDSFRITEKLSANRTNGPKDEINYTILINNTHKTSSIIVDLNINAPGLTVVSSPMVTQNPDGLSYSGSLASGTNTELKIKFKAYEFKNYTIKTSGIIKIGDYDLKYGSNKTLESIPPQVTAFIEVNNYTMNNTLPLSIWVKNDDLKEKYYYVYGFLRGLGEEEPLYINGVEPNSKALVIKKDFNISNKGESQLEIVFDGVYRDKNGVEYDLYDSKIAYINGTSFVVKKAVSTAPAVSKNTSSSAPAPANATTPQKDSPKSENSTSRLSSEKKESKDTDFITRMIEGLNTFFQSIFG